jgi:hypothetical protein
MTDQPVAHRPEADIAGPVGVRRGRVMDRLDTADGTVVLVLAPGAHRVVQLSEIGSSVLDVLEETGGTVGLHSLTTALVERLGAPGEVAPGEVAPETLVRTVVDALVAEHVVQWVAVAES